MYSKIKKRQQEYVKTKFSFYGKDAINNYLCNNNFTDDACEEYNPGSSKYPCRMYDDTKKKVMNMSTLCKPRIKRTTFKKWKLPERNRICAKGFIDCEFYKELEKKKKNT